MPSLSLSNAAEQVMRSKLYLREDLIKRLKEFVEYTGLSYREFCSKVNLNINFFNQRTTYVTEFAVSKVNKVYPELSFTWLTTGVGSMLTDYPVNIEQARMRQCQLQEPVSDHPDKRDAKLVPALISSRQLEFSVRFTELLSEYGINDLKQVVGFMHPILKQIR